MVAESMPVARFMCTSVCISVGWDLGMWSRDGGFGPTCYWG